jgi:PAS domain S-box-containing protein
MIDGLALAPPQHRPRAAARAAVAVVASTLAVALTVALAPVIPRASFVVAYAAVTVAAWYGGAWPGLLAGLLCVLGVDYYVIPPVGGLRLTDPADYVPMAVFVAVAWLTGTLTDSLRRARDVVERAAGDLRAANQQLHEQALELELSNQQLQDQAAELELQTEEAEDARRRAEAERAAAQESERRFRATADAAPVLIWTSGLDARCDWFNQPWLAFTGRPMEAELGNGWAERVHPDDFDRCLGIYLGAFHARAPFAMEYRLQRHDGVYRWLLDNAVPRFAADGTFVGYIGTCVDVTDQRLARETAERAAERATYLAEASARFAGSLDVEATLRTLADLAVPALADWAFVEVLEHGRVRPAAVANHDPAKVWLAYELLERYPIDLEAPFGTGKVLRTGQPELAPDIPDAALVAVAQDDAHLAALRQIGFCSSLSVPLLDPAGRAVAVLSLVSAESGRRYGEADLAMAEDVARRAAVTLAGARLFEAEQAALRRAAALQQVATALAGALTADEVARVVVRHGRSAVGAAAGSFFGVSADGSTFALLASEGYSEEAARQFTRFPAPRAGRSRTRCSGTRQRTCPHSMHPRRATRR